MAGLALAVLRLALAVVLALHGGHALFGGGTGAATVLAVVEFVGGLLLGIGLFTRVTALVVIGTMLYAVWRLHPSGMLLDWTGAPGPIEQSVVVLGALASLALSGAGALSVDGQRATSAATRAAGRARLRGKV